VGGAHRSHGSTVSPCLDYSAVGRAHHGLLPALGWWFILVVPVIGGLVYGPLIDRFAREVRGHGVPEVMLAVAEKGGAHPAPRRGDKVARVCVLNWSWGFGRARGANRSDRLRDRLVLGAGAARPRIAPPPLGRMRGGRRDLGHL